ncbi:glycosyltransferase [Spirillospora sp. CA-294931]|uniref:glycosyltransferase n=1 Tax=Spirillospora sp. CA-294931 TaxID=3240042 RepID=UPI003D94B98B
MQRTLTIALVSASGPDDEHTQSIHLRELSPALAREATEDEDGSQVTLYARRQDGAARTRGRLGPGATLQTLEAGPARPLEDEALLDHVRDLADGLRRRWSGAGRPDVVHAHGWIGGLAACAVAREMDLPFAFTPHGLATIELRAGRPAHPARARMEKAIAAGARVIVTACQDEAEALVRMGVPRKKISVIPYGVDTEQFCQVGPAMPRGERDRLVTVSRDLEDGGVATAIRALAEVPDAELAVAGGPDRDGVENDPAVHRLSLLAKELHVSDRVIFLGRMPRKSLPRLLRTARLVLSLSPDRPSPLVPLEAMACGVPVVATPRGGAADSVLDQITGLHVPAGRPVPAGRAIRRLLSEETTLHGYSIAAADRASSRYGWNRIAAEHLRAYERLVPKPEPEPEPETGPDDELAEALTM